MTTQAENAEGNGARQIHRVNRKEYVRLVRWCELHRREIVEAKRQWPEEMAKCWGELEIAGDGNRTVFREACELAGIELPVAVPKFSADTLPAKDGRLDDLTAGQVVVLVDVCKALVALFDTLGWPPNLGPGVRERIEKVAADELDDSSDDDAPLLQGVGA